MRPFAFRYVEMGMGSRYIRLLCKGYVIEDPHSNGLYYECTLGFSRLISNLFQVTTLVSMVWDLDYDLFSRVSTITDDIAIISFSLIEGV